MDNITIMEGPELRSLLASLGVENPAEIHTLRLHQRPDGIAIKINSGTWSPTLGRRADAGGY